MRHFFKPVLLFCEAKRWLIKGTFWFFTCVHVYWWENVSWWIGLTWLHYISAFVGHAEGLLFEDEGDGYEFTRGGYLLTRYVAELQSSAVTVRVSQMEGSWKRPRRRLRVQLLLGGGAMVCLLLSMNIVRAYLAFTVNYHWWNKCLKYLLIFLSLSSLTHGA